jgi:hypothetical protein
MVRVSGGDSSEARAMSRRSRFSLFSAVAAAVAVLNPGITAAATSGGWSNLGHGTPSTMPALNSKVQTFLRVGTKLYAGGDFTEAGGVANADHIAVWNGRKWSALGGGLGNAASSVYAIAVDGNNVYAAGSFQDAGGHINADLLAKFDGTTWNALAGPTLSGTPFALAIIGRTLYVGGSFDNAGDIATADSIAGYDMDTHVWSTLEDDNEDIGSTVSSIVTDGAGGLFVGGGFGNANGIGDADFVAHWTGGVSWSAMGASALNNRVRGLARSGSDLYVVGDFTNVAGIAAADKIARWTGSTWQSLGASSEFGEADTTALYDVVADGTTVVTVGYFKNAGGDPRADAIAAFAAGTWKNVGSNPQGTDGPVHLNSSLYAVEVVGTKLYAGGIESAIGGGRLNAYVAGFTFRRADALIGTPSPFVGNNVYNRTGVKQLRQLSVHRGETGSFSIKFTNDGLGPDTYMVKGPGTAGGFSVTYLNGTNNVTALVVAGNYSLLDLAPGASRTLTMKVAVGSGVTVGVTKSYRISQRSTGAGASLDVVKAVVKAT